MALLINGGLLSPHYELSFPKAYVIDNIKFESRETTLNENFLKEKYLTEGCSSKEIASLTFSSRSKITSHLKRFDIPLNKITRRVNGHHVFGYQKYKKRSIPLEREQKILNLIKEYRENGYSYQKIAHFLNEQKIKTKNEKGDWKPKVIRQIFLRIQKLEEV